MQEYIAPLTRACTHPPPTQHIQHLSDPKMSSTGTPYSTNPNQSGCKYCNAPYTLTFPSSATSNEAQVIFYGLSIIIFAVLLFLPLSSKWSVHGTYASYPPTKSNNILYLTVTLSYLFYSLLQFILISLEWADVLVTLKFLVYNVVVDFIYRVADVIVLAIMLMIVQRRYFAMAGGRRGVSWGIMGLLAAVNAASYAVNTASTAYSIKDGSHAGLLEVGRWVLLAYEAVYLLVVLGLGAIPVGFMGREERSKVCSVLSSNLLKS